MPGGGGSALIVGGGISGLSLAHYLIRGGRSGGQIRLVEAAQRTGGWIRTEQVELGRHGTVAYECGPRSLNRIRGGMTIELCAQLGLADSVIPASSEAKRRYVVGMDGQMQEMPSTIMGMLRSPLTRSMIPWLVRDLILPKRIPDRDISMNEFFSQRIGPDATSLLVSALSAGIYAGDPARLSMQSCLPSLIGMAQQSGSLTRGLCQTAMTKPVQSQAQQSPEMLSSLARINKRLGPAPIYTLEGGLSTLTGALERHLQPLIDIQTDCKVLSLCPRTLTVQTSDGNQRQYDHIYWTGSASSLASALSTKSATDDADIRSLQAALGQVQYASVACVTLVWTQAAVSAPLGFGVLVPSVVKNVPPVLGITFDSVTFPTPVSKDTTVMTVMIGGDRHPDLARAPESDLVELAHDAVRHLLGIPQKADYTAVNLARDAIPQFYVGHSQVIEKVAAGAARLHPHLHLVGTAVSGVAINDCIRNGSEMGHQVSDQDPVSGHENKVVWVR